MKRSDFSIIFIIAFVCIIIAYITAKALIAEDGTKSASVQHAESISSEVIQPDPTIFNSNAINPTVEVRIGE